jgi:hypothetical protein
MTVKPVISASRLQPQLRSGAFGPGWPPNASTITPMSSAMTAAEMKSVRMSSVLMTLRYRVPARG